MVRCRPLYYRYMWILALVVTTFGDAFAQTGYFGTATININPLTPIMLSGYAGRSSFPEATTVQENIVAQAAAFGSGAETSLLITVDSTGVPDNVIDPLITKLNLDLGIARDRIVISSTHSHSAPQIDGYLPNLFNPPLSPLKLQHIDQYTAMLSADLESVAISALNNRTPGHEYSWANGSVDFGANRRGEGVNDHDLPVMLVRDSLGQPSAVITSYATHGVTLNASDNLVSGDWPGYAREAIEAAFPGSTALVMLGAAGDSNPSPLGSVDYAQAHGQSVADEVQRLISQNLMTPVSQQISAFHSEIDLDYATTLQPGDPGSARLAPSPSSTPYGITSWTFGKDLAMVFMEGEVVADYSLRIKSELGENVWVNGYSNDVQSYIPSERILYAGGYEADDSTYYYGVPGRYAHGLEDKIFGAVNNQLNVFTGIGDRLRLSINWSTGEVSLANQGGKMVNIDGYTIVSPSGNLSAANGQWVSLQDQGIAGWDEADNADDYRLTEFNPSGSKVFNLGESMSLGHPLSLVQPAKFGDAMPAVDLTFEYSVPGEGTVQGILDTSSIAPINNLVLTIDPATGEAAIQNASPFFDVSIAAYTISSASGRLLSSDNDWHSLQDQGLVGWDQADNSNASRLTEFNFSGTTFLAGGQTVLHLGAPINSMEGEIPTEGDLDFHFLLDTGETMTGVILFGSVPSGPEPGDFDSDGDVDGADFLVWQRTFGGSAIPAGAGADSNGDGIVDAADLANWVSHYYQSVQSNSSAVPEPFSAIMMLMGLGIFVSYQHQLPRI